MKKIILIILGVLSGPLVNAQALYANNINNTNASQSGQSGNSFKSKQEALNALDKQWEDQQRLISNKFKQIDSNQDSKLTLSEWLLELNTKAPADISKAQFEFMQLDKNKDNVISWAEYSLPAYNNYTAERLSIKNTKLQTETVDLGTKSNTGNSINRLQDLRPGSRVISNLPTAKLTQNTGELGQGGNKQIQKAVANPMPVSSNPMPQTTQSNSVAPSDTLYGSNQGTASPQGTRSWIK